jgi:hypothetical protein
MEKVRAVRECAALIDWPCKIDVRFHEINMGLRTAVQDAVTYTTETYGQAIILEDDTIPGDDFVPYCRFMLEHFACEDRIAHISGYNVAPVSIIGDVVESSRISIYPESFAWATWQRAWSRYDESLSWGVNAPLSDIRAITGSTVGALKWRLNFHDAHSERINSWAYRWIASMWSNGQTCVSPNRNLVSYTGFTSGTHTKRKPRWVDLPVQRIGDFQAVSDADDVSEHVDRWLGRSVFGETLPGLVEGVLVSSVLHLLKLRRLRRKH